MFIKLYKWALLGLYVVLLVTYYNHSYHDFFSTLIVSFVGVALIFIVTVLDMIAKTNLEKMEKEFSEPFCKSDSDDDK